MAALSRIIPLALNKNLLYHPRIVLRKPVIGINQPCCYFSEWIHVEKRNEYVVEGEEFKNIVDNDKVYVIDVREKSEVADGFVPAKRYVNIPIGNIIQMLAKHPADFEKELGVRKPRKDEDIVVMCLGGIRSTWGLQVAQHFGFSKSKHYIGGWSEWQKNLTG